MAMEPGRFKKRIGAAVAVMLTSADPAFPTELTLTQDISSRGAQVIYRQPIRENVYAVGLGLIEPRGSWEGE